MSAQTKFTDDDCMQYIDGDAMHLLILNTRGWACPKFKMC